MKFLVLFIALTFATEFNKESNDKIFSQNACAPILVKIEEDEYGKVKKASSSKYIGVFYNETQERWQAYRYSKNEKAKFYNGYFKDEETAALASDTLARKLMRNGENHKLNFLDDGTEVYLEKTNNSKYIGVVYNQERSRWQARRKNKNKLFYNGKYKDEETAAQASDTLARILMENGAQKLKLNFPDKNTEVHAEKSTASKYIGVSYIETKERWRASRRSKIEKKMCSNGTYKDEETAAHASDTLARKLMENGEHHQLNFPDDVTEVRPKFRRHKRKRPNSLGVSQIDENFEKFE